MSTLVAAVALGASAIGFTEVGRAGADTAPGDSQFAGVATETPPSGGVQLSTCDPDWLLLCPDASVDNSTTTTADTVAPTTTSDTGATTTSDTGATTTTSGPATPGAAGAAVTTSPTIYTLAVGVREGNTNDHFVKIPVLLDQVSATGVRVHWQTTNSGTAKQDVDFAADSGDLVFPPAGQPGAKSQMITIDVLPAGGTISPTGFEIIKVLLSKPVGGHFWVTDRNGNFKASMPASAIIFDTRTVNGPPF